MVGTCNTDGVERVRRRGAASTGHTRGSVRDEPPDRVEAYFRRPAHLNGATGGAQHAGRDEFGGLAAVDHGGNRYDRPVSAGTAGREPVVQGGVPRARGGIVGER